MPMTCQKTLLSILLVFFLLFVSSETKADFFWNFIPKAKIEKLTNKYVFLNSDSKIYAPKEFKTHYNLIFQEITNLLERIKNDKKSAQIFIKIVPIGYNNFLSLKNLEGYSIIINDQKIEIFSPSLRGLLYGLTYLESLILKNQGEIPIGEIHNWPDLKIRALHLAGKATKAQIEEWIKKARFAHFNTLVIRIGKPIFRKKVWKKFKKNSDKLTLNWFFKLKEIITLDDFKEIINYAKENGLEIIPQIDFLTHQKTFIADIYPEFMFNIFTYDPRKDKLYTTVIFPFIDELISVIHPKAIHIGHDEVAGWNKWFLKKFNVKMLPSSLFLKDIVKLYDYLNKKGINVWMWGDMLLSPEECLSEIRKSCHGVEDYSKLRKLLPKDIVICDWHYFSEASVFNSAFLFTKDGYKVIGTTWFKEKTIKKFSKYITTLPYNNLGMMATTWIGSLRGKYKARNIEVSWIIEKSGHYFWNAKQGE